MDMDLPAMHGSDSMQVARHGDGRRPCCKDWSVGRWMALLHSSAHKRIIQVGRRVIFWKYVGVLPAMPISLTA